MTCIHGFHLGVAVGSGWQSCVAYINLGCYYLIGLPLGVVLGWHFHFGVEVCYFFIRPKIIQIWQETSVAVITSYLSFNFSYVILWSFHINFGKIYTNLWYQFRCILRASSAYSLYDLQNKITALNSWICKVAHA